MVVVVTSGVPMVIVKSVIPKVVVIGHVTHLAVMPIRADVMSPGSALVFAPMSFRIAVIVMVVRVAAEVGVGRKCARHIEPRVIVAVSLHCERCREADENR